MAFRLGYFRMRVRAHEWAERQRVSLLDVRGLGKAYLRVLYREKLSTAARIMTTSSPAIARRMRQLASFPQDSESGVKLINDWKRQIIELWRNQTSDPLPPGWEFDG